MASKLSEEGRQNILYYFDTDLTCVEVAAAFGVSHTTVQNVWLTVYSKDDLKQRRSRLMKRYKGENHHAYAGGITHLASGYKLVQAPPWYEGYRDKRGRALEHLVKYCEYHELTRIPDGFHVHHRNEDKTDS